MKELHKMKCRLCRVGDKPLRPEQFRPYMKQVSGWAIVDNKKIEREYVFMDFARALEFVNAVGGIAEAENHHPDILLHDYKKVKISHWTHAIGGLSENDFILACKIDRITAAE